MPETWASSGVDLHLDRTGPRVGRPGLEAQLREAVRSGRLAPGLRLPSSRSLAADLGVARNTVVNVYGQLVAEGWLAARQGSVTRVAGRAPVAEAGPPPEAASRRPRYDLRPGSPDVAAFPRSRWLAAARRALNTAPAEAFGDAPDARGRPELHQALADYLARARGVRVSPDRIVVCSGFTQGLGLICRVLRGRGAATLALEAYGLPDLRGIAAAHGLRTRTLPVDGSGAVLDGLGDAEAVLLTPAHQFPLGGVLAPRRRTRAIEWAARTGGLLIEDDYDGEFRYDRQPVGAMQALGAGARHLRRDGQQEPRARPAAGLARRARPPGGRGDRSQGPHRPAFQQLRPAHAGRVPHFRGLRPAGAPLAAGLPAPPGPSRRGGAPPRPAGAGDRHRRRAACAAGTAARPGRGRDHRPGRGPARPGPRRAAGPTAPRPARIGRRWSSGTPPRPSTPSPAPSPG